VKSVQAKRESLKQLEEKKAQELSSIIKSKTKVASSLKAASVDAMKVKNEKKVQKPKSKSTSMFTKYFFSSFFINLSHNK